MDLHILVFYTTPTPTPPPHKTSVPTHTEAH